MVQSEAGPAFTASACSEGVRSAFEFLGKRWNGVIIGSLAAGPMGFAELRRAVGHITDSVLSDRLAEMVAGGLVERTVTDTRPPGVSYRLTVVGAELVPILEQLGGWADRHLVVESCPPTQDC